MASNWKASILEFLLNDLPSAELLLLINWRDSAAGDADVRKLEQTSLLCQGLNQLACLWWGGQVAEDVDDGRGVVDVRVGEAEAGELHAALDHLECVSSGPTVDEMRTGLTANFNAGSFKEMLSQAGSQLSTIAL